MTELLKGFQRKYLRSLGHRLKPVVLVGQKGAAENVVEALEEALAHHELAKIKFIANKDRTEKSKMADELRQVTGAHLVGTLGHTALFYRPHPQPDQRKIVLPQRDK
jgi:RNA-binding protein